MLDNNVDLVFEASAGTATTTNSVSLIDTDNGRSVRRKNLGNGIFVDLIISHEEARQKDGLISDRHLVRIDYTIPDPVISTAPTAVVSAYNVLVYPRRSDITHGHVGQVFTALRNLLKDSSTHESTTASDAILARLFAGES